MATAIPESMDVVVVPASATVTQSFRCFPWMNLPTRRRRPICSCRDEDGDSFYVLRTRSEEETSLKQHMSGRSEACSFFLVVVAYEKLFLSRKK